jgi:hypothetical protein
MRWVALALAGYAGLIVLVLCMVRAASTADRSERLVVSEVAALSDRSH